MGVGVGVVWGAAAAKYEEPTWPTNQPSITHRHMRQSVSQGSYTSGKGYLAGQAVKGLALGSVVVPRCGGWVGWL